LYCLIVLMRKFTLIQILFNQLPWGSRFHIRLYFRLKRMSLPIKSLFMKPTLISCLESWKVKIFENFAKKRPNHATNLQVYIKPCYQIRRNHCIARI
jgi:hypothetical protein